MGTIIDSELTKISTKIYGEDIRGAIHDALKTLAERISGVPTSSDIEEEIDDIIDGFKLDQVLKVKGTLSNQSNLNAYGTTKNGAYTGIYFLYNERSYYNLPSGLKQNEDAIFININGSDSAIDADAVLGSLPFIQIVIPIVGSFKGPFWIRTSISTGWVNAGSSTSEAIADAVGEYLDHNEDFATMVQDFIDRQGGMSESTVKGLIEGYVDKDNTSNDDGKTKFNASVDARIDAKPIRSSTNVEGSLKAFIDKDATVVRTIVNQQGEVTNKYTNEEDVKNLISPYNSYDDSSNTSGYSIRAAIADGLLGLAAFKRTQWFPTPQMYGAKGDNSTDDTKAIQDAINDNQGKTLYFPAGTYIITDTISIAYGNNYTDMIFDPSAVIKAGSGWDAAHTTNGVTTGAGMLSLGSWSYHDISKTIGGSTARKGRKKIFKGGVFDSNYQFITTMIRVSPDINDFDMSDSVLLATDSTTGLAIGTEGWTRKKVTTIEDGQSVDSFVYASLSSGGTFHEESMDAYVHHITIMKYGYRDLNPGNYNNWSDYIYDRDTAGTVTANHNNKHNRASGIVIYTSDNNFDNIRVCYFKRNVKITYGNGNYFSDVHTLGLQAGKWVNGSGNNVKPEDVAAYYTDHSNSLDGSGYQYVTNVYDSSHYPDNSSGFHLERPSDITLDQCYVDTDNHFLYEDNTNVDNASGAGGSKIHISQCTHLQWEGANNTMASIRLCPSGKTLAPAVSKLYIDGFLFSPRGKVYENHSRRHTGIAINRDFTVMDGNTLVSSDYGQYFCDQMNTYNLTLEDIRVDGPDRLQFGDPLLGAISGNQGHVLFKPTSLTRNSSSSTYSRWFALCDIPVGRGKYAGVSYWVTLYLTGRYIRFPMSIKKWMNESNPNDTTNRLIMNLGSKAASSDELRKFEIGFTDNHKGSFFCYRMWIRLIEGAYGENNANFVSRSIESAIFESNTCITPATTLGSYTTLTSQTTNPSFVNMRDGDAATDYKTFSIGGALNGSGQNMFFNANPTT